MEAAARDGFTRFKNLKLGKRCAGKGAAKADGQRAWWQLPRGSHAAVGGL